MDEDAKLKKVLGTKIMDILHSWEAKKQGTCKCCGYYTWNCWLCDFCETCCKLEEKRREQLECIKEDKLNVLCTMMANLSLATQCNKCRGIRCDDDKQREKYTFNKKVAEKRKMEEHDEVCPCKCQKLG